MTCILWLSAHAAAACLAVIVLAMGVGTLAHGTILAVKINPEIRVEPSGIMLIDVNRRFVDSIAIIDNDEANQDNTPVWSPDGRRIAVSHFRYRAGEGPFACVMDVGGANQRCPGVGTGPEWVSSSQLAFEYGRSYLMNLETGETANLSGDLPDGSSCCGQSDLDWSANSNMMTFTAGLSDEQDIYVVEPDGDGLRNLTNQPASYSDPSWSPDGQYIAFVYSRDYEDEAQIYVMNSDGTNLRQLTEEGGSGIAWSPDGAQIAYQEEIEIHLMDADGANDRVLAQGRLPTWSPDGSRIAFIGLEETDTEIYLINRDGSGLSLLVNFPLSSPTNAPPAWSP